MTRPAGERGGVPQAVAAAIKALVESVHHDENRSGGMLSRETLRKAAELEVAVACAGARVREAEARG